MAAAIEGHKPGDEVEIEYYRGDEKQDRHRDAGQAPDEAAQSEPQRRAQAAGRRSTGRAPVLEPGCVLRLPLRLRLGPATIRP